MANSGCRMSMWIGVCLALSIAAQTVRAQNYRKTYKVGDEVGWTFMNETSGQPADYEAWAAQHTFFVNDVLEFVYEPTESDVRAFPNIESFTTCNISATKLLDNGTSGTSEWFLPNAGFYNFGSSKHCKDGQKFRIFVNVSTVPYVPEMPGVGMPPMEGMAPEPATMAKVPAKAPSASAARTVNPTWILLVAVIAASISFLS